VFLFVSAAKDSVRYVERGRLPKPACWCFAGSELVAAAKSVGLSPMSVESYDELICRERERTRRVCGRQNMISVWESVVLIHDRLF
jgi:hypothetical protein